ncbi:MAG: PASTA domain-containing protein [Desulfuromonadales bacterium]|nr:PASTA domain-containing protein [Desulfuromonadales bacterium]
MKQGTQIRELFIRSQVKFYFMALLMLMLSLLSPGMREAGGETLPVKMGGSIYDSILSAYSAAQDGSILQCLSMEYREGVFLNKDVDVTLAGGYAAGFDTIQGGATTSVGELVVAAGSVTVQNLTIKLPSTAITVPNVVAMTNSLAQSTIVDAKLVVGLILSQYSAAVPAGQVIGQYPPAGNSAIAGDEIGLVVSAGIMPNHPLVPITYSLVKDSNGTVPSSGVHIYLAFEPSGTALLVIATDTDGLSYQGSYSFGSNTLTLAFTDPDLSVNKTFALDPSASTVTMPFKVFSSGVGTSTWNRQELPLTQNLSIIFQGATYAVYPYLPTEQAIDRVVAYLGAYGALPQSGQTTQSGARDIVTFADSQSSSGPTLTSVGRAPNGVTLYYDNGPPVEVMLYNNIAGEGKTLTLAQLASDPRVHLNVTNPDNPMDDPDEKTALFVGPYYSTVTSSWYDYLFANGQDSPANISGLDSVKMPFSDMASILQGRGYTVQTLLDNSVTVPNLVDALTPGHGGRSRSPAFVVINTHGGKFGGLATGVPLAKDNPGFLDETPIAFRLAVKKLALIYPDLPLYNGGTMENPKTLGHLSEPMTGSTGHVHLLTVKPDFWSWLREKQNADFHKSLVYIAACSTDSTSYLRDAVEAKAYFAYGQQTWQWQAASVFKYLVNSLARPTHTAEEAYYNILRVYNTGQMIYKEDKVFDGFSPPNFTVGPLAQSLNGYGYDPTHPAAEVFPYQSGGWLKTAGNPGNVWWLLFAGRWGQDAQDGATALENCWNTYWSKGSTGGLASPFCNNAAPAGVQDIEVAYATYLLTGTALVKPDIFKTPRFTLHDGN